MGLYDFLFITAILVIPLLILLLWKRIYIAYPVSVLSFWLLMIAYPASYLFDPEKDNHLGFVMSLYFGWIPGLIYCGLFTLFVPKIRLLMTGKKPKQDGVERKTLGEC